MGRWPARAFSRRASAAGAGVGGIADPRRDPAESPAATGPSHWPSRQLAAHVKRTEGVCVSWYCVATLSGANTGSSRTARAHLGSPVTRGSRPRWPTWLASSWTARRRGGVNDRREDAGPGAGRDPAAAAGRLRPSEDTHDYIRHGTTNLFAALNTTTGLRGDPCGRPTDKDSAISSAGDSKGGAIDRRYDQLGCARRPLM